MTDLPPIPEGKDYTEATWRAGLDEAIRRHPRTVSATWSGTIDAWSHFLFTQAIESHAITLLDAGIVKPVVSEGALLLEAALLEYNEWHGSGDLHECPDAIKVIDAALAKARADGIAAAQPTGDE